MNVGRALRILLTSLNVNKSVTFRLFYVLPFFAFAAFTLKPNADPFNRLITSLQRWTDSIPQEKVYLHMDKPYYALGDTIWFKGYVTIGSRHQLSKLSGAVYVDLINERDSLLKSLKLPVTAGMVMGDFVLVDDYKQGSYRIRAYTQWMRNAGPDYFFDRTFTVGDLLTNNLVAKADYQYRNVDGKQELTALLNFTNDEGRALGERNLRYQIVIGNKVVWTQSTKTDALGSARIKIDNAAQANLNGAYIRASIETANKYQVTRDFPIKAEKAQNDVQFFPESGGLVNGIASRVGFKAIGVDGLGISIKGTVVDDAGVAAAEISTQHAGMGSFILKPQAGKSYSAKITFPYGVVKTVPLPKAADEGYTLGVYLPGKDSVLVRINASASILKQPQGVALIAHTGGENIYSSTLKITKPMTNVWLSKKDFPSGIAQFTLFDAAGQPINERIAFIRSKDLMELDIRTNKDHYKGKEHIKIDLVAKDSKGKPTAANFSVTVVDEGKMPVEESKESTIFSHLLLTSDLKGYVESPNYYFTKETDEVNRALDNLMLTQGYRRFVWSRLDSLSQAKPKFEVEGLGAKITGRVTTLTNQPLPNADVVLNSVIAGVTKFTKSNDRGRFTFDGIFLTDSLKFAVQARGPKGTDKVKILVDSVPKQVITPNVNLGDVSTNIAGTLKEYIDNGKKQDDIYEKLGLLDKVHRLREVRIKARKPVPPIISNQGMYRIPEGHSDQVIMMNPADSIDSSIASWLSLVANRIHFKERIIEGIQIPLYPYIGNLPLKVFLDGREITDGEELNAILSGFSLQPEGIYKVELVLTSPALKVTLGGPSLMIFTRRDYIRKNYNPSIANISPKGFNKVREFYSPRYDKPGVSKLPDLRTTVYWNPYLKTDANGKTTFNFFNADGPANYKVIVEGINADGELGRQVYRYTVDGSPVDLTAPLLRPDNSKMDYISKPFNDFSKRLPVEKVYLHTDKPYYNLGDTLWFKAYVVNGRDLAPTNLSGLLYVELNDDTLSNVRRVSLPIKDGIACGQIPLTKKIFREGALTLRAYTNWMQNYGEDYLFSQRIYLGTLTNINWLVTQRSSIKKVGMQDELEAEIKLNRIDKFFSPVALRKMRVRLFDDWHYIYDEDHQTGIDGSIQFSHLLKKKTNVGDMHVQIMSLEKADKGKVVRVPLTLIKKLDLQFLPEGGQLVAGLKSTVGFKALADNGKGTSASGGIFDAAGQQVATFSTLHNGMGSFDFTPQAGQTYTAHLSQPSRQSFELPVVKTQGTVMHISNPEQADMIRVGLQHTADVSLNDSCFLVGTARGTIYYSEAINTNQPDIAIAKNLFPTGIARFTLFKGKRPISERAVFIDHQDGLSINIMSDKAYYNKRDSVSLSIAVRDKQGFPVQGNFSIAVIDNEQVRADTTGNNNIRTSLLLNSDLKGFIEDPGYYINRKNKLAWQALDNLLLTQGWTGYNWPSVFGPAKKQAFDAEKSLKITGLVSNISKKPLANREVIISSQKPFFISSTRTDSAGIYIFKDLPVIDSGSFFIQANNKNGSKMSFGNISVKNFVPPPVAPYQMPVVPWYINTDSTTITAIKRKLQKDQELQLKGNVLKEVVIKKQKIIKDSFLWGDADLTYDEQDIKESAVLNIYELLKQKIPGLRVTNNWSKGYNGRAMLLRGNEHVKVLIDGLPLPLHIDNYYSIDELIDELSQIKAVTLKGLQIRFFPGDARLPPGIGVELTTKNGRGWYRLPKTGTATYRPLPLMYPQQFYSPKYTIRQVAAEPDFRSTIFWAPNIVTDAEGKAKVSFYTSDSANNFTVKIAGIDASGNLGDAMIKINNQIKP